jgi:hypothetical protein
VFVADLTGELRAWPTDTWAKVGVDPDQVAQAVIGCWRDGEVTGLQLDDLSFEETRSLTRPAMTYVRGQLRGRLTARLARVHRRWLHPTSSRRPDDRFPSRAPTGRTPDAAECPPCPDMDGMPDGQGASVRAASAAGPLLSSTFARWPCRPDTDRPQLWRRGL